MIRIILSINFVMINISKEQIENIINKLEKLEIIGEIVLKYWEKDKIYCQLKIKNRDYKIRTTKIEATEKENKIIKCALKNC